MNVHNNISIIITVILLLYGSQTNQIRKYINYSYVTDLPTNLL